MLGDIQISAPNALIGFAGQRVIENTIREKLPEGFQRAEYLLDHGMIDMVVHRSELRARLSQIISRSEEHTSELQSLMRISYAVFCLTTKTIKTKSHPKTSPFHAIKQPIHN